ncbi:hypothetical protein HMPREF1619_05969 [Klebsiella pneumoniae 909957]|nr:hypothetical protein HMPREF1619_05969 [Klebsiella pneumoniae 909957]
MIVTRQRCKAQTEAERSTASTEQSEPRSGIKRYTGLAVSPLGW